MTDADLEWVPLASCREIGNSKYFVWDEMDDESRPEVMHRHSKAREICYRDCPVQLECLRYCVDTDSTYLIWGGLTPSQRKRYIGRRQVLSNDRLAAIIVRAGTRVLNRIERQAQEA